MISEDDSDYKTFNMIGKYLQFIMNLILNCHFGQRKYVFIDRNDFPHLATCHQDFAATALDDNIYQSVSRC